MLLLISNTLYSLLQFGVPAGCICIYICIWTLCICNCICLICIRFVSVFADWEITVFVIAICFSVFVPTLPGSNLAYFRKQKGRHITCLMSNGIILVKGLISPLSLLLGVWNVKTTCRKSWPGNLFQMLNLTSDPYQIGSTH